MAAAAVGYWLQLANHKADRAGVAGIYNSSAAALAKSKGNGVTVLHLEITYLLVCLITHIP